ncbi:hypothetical protein C4559_06455 [Candidatus Microgenomates bacterium]|nr:MAG: hypothetical protein C4559_06455 [Candidatus Microgenomates bacterium]
MRTDKFIKVTYKQIDSSPRETQQRLDDVFDLLFDEILLPTNKENSAERNMAVSLIAVSNS